MFASKPQLLYSDRILSFPLRDNDRQTNIRIADIMHSYLGLAALACMREPDLKSIDPALCFSVSAREAFENRVAGQS